MTGNGLIKSVVVLALLCSVAAFAGQRTTILAIDQMHCALCAPAVSKALEQVEGVESVDVSVADKRAVVVADEAVAAEALIAAVARAGFAAEIAKDR